MDCKYVATIGFFDGVHKGHRYLINKVCEMARAEGLQSMVITFDRHPREVLQADYRPQLLTTPSVKVSLLRQTGADRVEVLHFTRELAALSAREFMDRVLCRELHVCRLVIGYDHRFGHDRAEGFDDYVRYGRELGIEVVQNNEMKLQFHPSGGAADDTSASVGPDAAAARSALAAGMHVSSTTIRRLLSCGNVGMAAMLLDRHHTLLGHVVHGFAEGRKMGYPTANLDTAGYPLLVPAAGVYAVAVRVCRTGSELDEPADASPVTVSLDEFPPHLAEGWMPAMLNIGTRPTFGGSGITVEAHILNFCGDIYGRPMAVAFYEKIRDEHRFASIEALGRQLAADRDAVRRHFGMFSRK